MKLTEKEVRDALEEYNSSHNHALCEQDKDEVIHRFRVAGLIKEQRYIVRIPDVNDRKLYWSDTMGWHNVAKTNYTMSEIVVHPVLKHFVGFAVEVDE